MPKFVCKSCTATMTVKRVPQICDNCLNGVDDSTKYTIDDDEYRDSDKLAY